VIKHILDSGQLGPATVHGWVRTRRDSKAGLSFIQLNDGSCMRSLQVVANNNLNNYAQILTLSSGAAIKVSGEIVASAGKNQSVELVAHSLEIIGPVEDAVNYPIQPKRHTMEFLRGYPHLRIRTNTFAAIARVRHGVSKFIHDFFHENDFLWVHTPIITANDCEGAGELFRVSTLEAGQSNFAEDFFGKQTYLTVSGQLNVESYCCAMSKVYTFGPTFRAENSNTSRHLSEFWMVEPEIAFATLDDVAQLAIAMLQYIIKRALAECREDLEFFDKYVASGLLERLTKVASCDVVKISYTKAIELLQQANKKFEFPVKWGLDLQSEHERYLTEELYGQPVIISDYPREIKSFYMRLNDDQKTVAALDVLVPGIGEIIGGSTREERFDVLQQRLIEMDLVEDFRWYLDLRRYGSVPHGGFGLGLERLLGYITGVANVRDLIPFPRTPNNALY